MDREIKFSFLKLFNSIKGIHKPEKQYDETFLEEPSYDQMKEKFEKFLLWCEENGVQHPKVKYPVLFGSGDSKYPGMMATEDIGKDEIIVKVPAKLLLSIKTCFRGDINKVFLENPQVFGKHVPGGEDNVLNAFLLYELAKGENSSWKPMFDVWPRDTDILMNWDDEDLDWLQDPTLKQDAQNEYKTLIMFWRNILDVLRKYPEFFPNEECLSFEIYKWVYMLTTNRCFGSNWPGVCSMIPYADLINHENVDVQYDYLDQNDKSITGRREERKKEEKEQKLMQALKKKLFMEELREDLKKMDQELRNIQNKNIEFQDESENQIMMEAFEKEAKRKEMEFKLRVQLDSSSESSSEESSEYENDEKQEKKQKQENKSDYDYSSGIDSDNDADLLLEQEQLNALKFRQQQKKTEEEEQRQRGELPSYGEDVAPVLTNQQVYDIWENTVSKVPDDFNFVIKTYNEGFPRGSQVFLCYGRMSNREQLKRYGFCLTYNKYNYLFIKLRLEQQDPDFVQRKYVIRKFFSVDPESDKMDISSRHFRIYMQKLNTKVLKFIKILNFNVKEDDISCIVETRSLSLEYLSFQRLRDVYETFLKSFPTSIAEDKRILKEQQEFLTGRQFFGLTYRMEFKRILINQINLVKLVIHILERLMKGMTLEFAVTRVFELESKKEMVVNRIMIDNYLTSLKKGLEKNQQEYMEIQKKNKDNPAQYLMEQQRRLRLELPNSEVRRHFEIQGYDKMIDRIMEGPLKSSQSNNNSKLQQRLEEVKRHLITDQDKTVGKSYQEQIDQENKDLVKAMEIAKEVKNESSSEEEGSEYGSEYESEEDSDNEKIKLNQEQEVKQEDK